jgi:hypothetical protein
MGADAVGQVRDFRFVEVLARLIGVPLDSSAVNPELAARISREAGIGGCFGSLLLDRLRLVP